MNTKLNILVIDDSVVHQKSARQVLGAEHNLTVVGTHDGAIKLLCDKRDNEKYEALKALYKEQGVENYYERAGEESRLPYWDAVLSDLLMPAGQNNQGREGDRHVGKEMPIGWSLAITAALRGAKYVAVITDMNHHSHPASAMLDAMNYNVFDLNGAKALFTNHVKMVGLEETKSVCTKCSGTGNEQRGEETRKCSTCEGKKSIFSKNGKDWAKILSILLNPPKSEMDWYR